jgi:beta-glucosidase
VILCLGEASYAEGGGNINDLTLYEAQLNLAEQIAAAGRPIVLVLVEGRPRIISRIADRMTAIVMAYNPGNEGGMAIADVLFGDYNPCGKLPITYPRSPNALFTYDHKGWGPPGRGPVPQFEFGYGLSYTTFAYSDPSLEKKSARGDDELMLSVTVTNEGQRAGKEVVQLYVRDLVASITPSFKRLKRFAKVYLEPSQSRTLTFRLRRDDFSFIGADNRLTVEPGQFEIFVGNLNETFTLEQ